MAFGYFLFFSVLFVQPILSEMYLFSNQTDERLQLVSWPWRGLCVLPSAAFFPEPLAPAQLAWSLDKGDTKQVAGTIHNDGRQSKGLVESSRAMKTQRRLRIMFLNGSTGHVAVTSVFQRSIMYGAIRFIFKSPLLIIHILKWVSYHYDN